MIFKGNDYNEKDCFLGVYKLLFKFYYIILL